jgi:rhodanese-related sulfurtransferase
LPVSSKASQSPHVSASTDDRDDAGTISPAELRDLMTKKNQRVVIVDIRDRQEFHEGHLPTAKNIPVDEIGARVEDELHREDKIILYADCMDCNGKQRSGELQQQLIAFGYSQVKRLKGGLEAWRKEGFEVVAGQKL